MKDQAPLLLVEVRKYRESYQMPVQMLGNAVFGMELCPFFRLDPTSPTRVG
jgi:hypothetical protein